MVKAPTPVKTVDTVESVEADVVDGVDRAHGPPAHKTKSSQRERIRKLLPLFTSD
jgi:hypothetical protein